MSDMAQLLGAKDRQSLVAYSFIIYDYVTDTKVDICSAAHYLLMRKLIIT
jgi:hypothetical protein